MSAFASWYAANVTPQLEETLKTLPVAAREPLRTASRMSMAACWNGALEAAAENQRPASAEEIVTHIYSLRTR